MEEKLTQKHGFLGRMKRNTGFLAKLAIVEEVP